jgi:ribosomal protein S12 methylthiotransferase
MKRGSSGAAFLKQLARIRRTIPGVSIRTSFIVGFPGETEDDFRELCDFVRIAEFDWLGVFAYSDEQAAQSFGLQGKVRRTTIERRRHRLMAIQKKISARKLRARVGRRYPALLEGPSRESDMVWEARLEGMAPDIDGKVYVTDLGEIEADRLKACPAPRAGAIVSVEITKAHDYDLIGRVVALHRGGLTPPLSAPATVSTAVADTGFELGRDKPAPALARVPTGAPLRILT